MPRYRHEIARSFVLRSARLHPLRRLDEAILLGLLRATGAVDSRHRTVRRPPAVHVSPRWLPAQGSLAAGDLANPAKIEQKRQLESIGLAARSGGRAR